MAQHRLQLLYTKQPAARLDTLHHVTQQQTPECRQCNWALGVYKELKRSLGALSIDSAFADYKECLHTSHVNTYTQASRFRHPDLKLNSPLTVSCHYGFLTGALARIIPGLKSASQNDWVHAYPAATIIASWAGKEEKTVLREMVLLRTIAMAQTRAFPPGGTTEVRMQELSS